MEDCLVGERTEGDFVDAMECFLEETDLRFGDVGISNSREGRGGKEGRRGGMVGTGDRTERVGGRGKVIEGIGFGEGIDRRESREGDSDMVLWRKVSLEKRGERKNALKLMARPSSIFGGSLALKTQRAY